MTAVTHVVVGPPRHGVVRFGRELHEALTAAGVSSPLLHCAQVTEISSLTGHSGVHLQFTDQIFGRTPEDAAAAVAALVDAATRAGVRVTATLHDLPQPSDGRHHRTRTAAYADICARVHAVIVSSDHERELLRPYAPSRVAVVPLPIRPVDHPGPVDPSPPSIGVFGFVYPGKGHLEVIAATSRITQDVDVIAIGEVSRGHDDLVVALQECARASQVPFRLTGHVPDATLAGMLRSVTVPIAPHRHVSASGSINSWLSAGRRPLAPVNRYTEEIMLRNPDALELYPDTEVGLRTAIKRALDDPLLTWLPASTALTPTVEQVAAQYHRLLTEWHR